MTKVNRKIIPFLLVSIVLIGGLIYLKSTKDSAHFQLYEPTVLPNDLSIKSRKEIRWNWQSKNYDRSLEYEIELNTEHVSIGESKRTKESDEAMKCEDIGNEICEILHTPAGHKYIRIDSIDDTSDAAVPVIRFVKGDTYIWLTITGDSETEKYTNQDWGATLDSFHPVESNKDVSIEYQNYGP